MTTEENLRAAVERERRTISDLDNKLSDHDLKQQLRLASSQLDLVASCIDPKTMAEPRTPRQVAWWLSQTERIFRTAVEIREEVQDNVRRFGSGVKAV
jgi:hypothetical protein